MLKIKLFIFYIIIIIINFLILCSSEKEITILYLPSTISTQTINSSTTSSYTTSTIPMLNNCLYIEPYLQNISYDRVTIMWWTNILASTNYVIYGSSLTQSISATSEYISVIDKYLNKASIISLTENTLYPYQTISDECISGTYSFKTASSGLEDVHLCFLGDGRTDNPTIIANHLRIAEHVLAKNPDFVIYGGDMVGSGEQAEWEKFFQQVMTQSPSGCKLGSMIPCFYTVGNHEIYEPSSGGYSTGGINTTMVRFKSYVDNPSNSSINPDWEERYYSFKYGPATFIIIDANNTSADSFDNSTVLPDNVTPDWEPGSEQYNWLVGQLDNALTSSVFTFIVFHIAPYTRGYHGASGDSVSGYQVRELDSLFRSKGVDGVFNSHDHLVERSLTGTGSFWTLFDDGDPNNLNYFVQGNSGESSRSAASGWEAWMQIPLAPSGSYYSRYFYSWEGTDTRSFNNILLHHLGSGIWQAIFQTISVDINGSETINDTISFTRSL